MAKEIHANSISEAVGTILAKICYPAAQELGESAQEPISNWRRQNSLAVLRKTGRVYEEQGITEKEHAHPRLVHSIVVEGSWSDDDIIQDMWAGLLVSSCSEDGSDDSNLIFVNVMRQLSSVEARILKHACESADKTISEAGWLYAKGLNCGIGTLQRITGVSDLQRLDRELDHLRSLELIEGGFNRRSTTANITPSGLALQLYARCQGFRGSPIEYFGL